MRALLTLLLPGLLLAAEGATPPAVRPDGPALVMPTPRGSGAVRVVGAPRQAEGHPCTTWDREDVADLRRRLASDAPLAAALADLRKRVDKQLATPPTLPVADGPPPTQQEIGRNSANGRLISDLGTLWALTGEARYGEEARRLVLGYARVFPRLAHTKDWTPKRYRSAHDGRIANQFLEDGFWLIYVARGYDLVYDLPSWTADERRTVRDDLFTAYTAIFRAPEMGQPDYLSQQHNRSVVCAAATLMAGYASDNPELVTMALYGTGGTPEQPKGGLIGLHLTPACILADGLWLEGAPAYQLGITSAGLFTATEVMWRHGLDLYGHRDGLLKRMLDSAVDLAYPEPGMGIAALRDSGPMALRDPRGWVSNEVVSAYELGWLRYGEPRYQPIVTHGQRSLSTTVHAGPASLFPALPAGDPPRIEPRCDNFPSTGYGVLRLPAAGGGTHQALLEFGPSGSHGHPSKLGLDLFVGDEVLMPMPGVIFPYQDPLNQAWYWTTLANNALVVDGLSQLNAGSLWREPKGTPVPTAAQEVFVAGPGIAMQRAGADNLYRQRFVQDRALFLTPGHLVDLYAVEAAEPHRYDLAWHLRGRLELDRPTSEHRFPEPVADGYRALDGVRRAEAATGAWTATATTPKGRTVRLLGAGGTPAELITGLGHAMSPKGGERVPTLVERREGLAATVFATVADLDGTVRSLRCEGGPERGFALLHLDTTGGGEWCYVGYRDRRDQPEGLSTDARQAWLRAVDGRVTALAVAGASRLRFREVELSCRPAGLLAMEVRTDGTVHLTNPGSMPMAVTLAQPGLAGRRTVRDGATASPPAATDRWEGRLAPGGVVDLRP